MTHPCACRGRHRTMHLVATPAGRTEDWPGPETWEGQDALKSRKTAVRPKQLLEKKRLLDTVGYFPAERDLSLCVSFLHQGPIFSVSAKRPNGKRFRDLLGALPASASVPGSAPGKWPGKKGQLRQASGRSSQPVPLGGSPTGSLGPCRVRSGAAQGHLRSCGNGRSVTYSTR